MAVARRRRHRIGLAVLPRCDAGTVGKKDGVGGFWSDAFLHVVGIGCLGGGERGGSGGVLLGDGCGVGRSAAAVVGGGGG